MDRIRNVLSEAVAQGIITEAQAQSVQELAHRKQEGGQDSEPASEGDLRFTHTLYYLGGLIAIGAMSVFMTLGWEEFGAWGLLSIAVAYAGIGIVLTEGLYRRRYSIPAGLTATLVIVLLPLAVYGLQLVLGWWPEEEMHRPFFAGFDPRELMLQGVAAGATAIALWRYRLPFLMLAVSALTWYIGMSTASIVFDLESSASAVYLWISCGLGLVLAGGAFLADRDNRWRPFAFWPYTIGGVVWWGSLSFLALQSSMAPGLYAALNVLGLIVGVGLGRRVFVITSAVGIAGYLAYLAYNVFEGSVWFPFALTIIGLAIVGCGIWWQRHEDEFHRWVKTYMKGPTLL